MLRNVGVAVTVFGCGWVLMGLQMVGGRMLSPYFGSGVEVWGSVIGVFLLALSAGYFLGGLLSARFPSAGGLAAVIFAAAVSVVPVAFGHAAVGDYFSTLDLSERWGALLTATSLFFLPSLLLGIVSPYAVHLVTRQVARVGMSAGSLYAVSTVGSFLGCIHTAFYLIVWMGIQNILFLAAAPLALLAVWMVVVWTFDRLLASEPNA